MTRRASRFNVAPRYSGGSPAQVDERTARRVAEEERRSYERALEEVYGPEDAERARRLGLAGIVEERVETSSAWRVRDLLTGETFLRPFRAKAGDRVQFTWRPDGRTHVGYLLKGGTVRCDDAGPMRGQYLKARDCDDLVALPKPIPPETF